MFFATAVRHIPEDMLLSSALKIKSPSIPQLVKLISLQFLWNGISLKNLAVSLKILLRDVDYANRKINRTGSVYEYEDSILAGVCVLRPEIWF
jgi:hypothetical protein